MHAYIHIYTPLILLLLRLLLNCGTASASAAATNLAAATPTILRYCYSLNQRIVAINFMNYTKCNPYILQYIYIYTTPGNEVVMLLEDTYIYINIYIYIYQDAAAATTPTVLWY